MIEPIRIVADWLADPLRGVNALASPTTIYVCTDEAPGSTFVLSGTLTPAATGPVRVTCRIYKGSSAQSFILCVVGAIQILRAVIDWADLVATVTMVPIGGQPAGTLISQTLLYPGAYELVLEGVATTTNDHLVQVVPASNLAAAMTDAGFGAWAVTNGTLNDDMTTWSPGAAPGSVTAVPPLPLDAGDAAPPPIATILDDSTNGIVARRRWPQGYGPLPALLVFNAGQLWPGGKTQALRRGDATVGIALLMAEPDTEEGIEDISYLWRAALRAIDTLSEAAHENDRQRAQVWLEYIDRVEFPPVEPWLEDVLIAADMRVFWKVRNLAP